MSFVSQFTENLINVDYHAQPPNLDDSLSADYGSVFADEAGDE
jgi:hypothetical protein